MTTYLALLPGFFAVYYALSRSPAKAFMNIYIPVLLLLPQIYKAEMRGFHDMNTSEAAIIPIFFIYVFFQVMCSKWNWKGLCLTDGLVVGFVLLCTYSEYLNTGGEAAYLLRGSWVSLLSSNIAKILMPYFLTKWLIVPSGLTIPLAKRMTILMIVNLFLCFYEWRFVINPHLVWLSDLFPGQLELTQRLPNYRFGWIRIAGPFFHPILFGIMFAVVLLLNIWLERNKLWSPHFRFLPNLPVSKGKIFTALLFGGLLLTLSRGPLYSVLIAGLFLGLAYSRNRRKSLLIRLAILGAMGWVFYEFYQYYSGIDRTLAETDLSRNTAYRLQLINKYKSYVLERLWWGWGYTTLPEADHMLSIDNQYLFLLLKHGLFSLVTLILIPLYLMARLFKRGMALKNHNKMDRSFAFTLFSIYFMLCISLLTVYMGEQIEPMFFILAGWAEGFLQTHLGEERLAAPLLRPITVAG